jgi:pimeloyl-ACP methyl ester carboxylesterase
MNKTIVRSKNVLMWQIGVLTIPGYTERLALRRLMTPARQEPSRVPQVSGLLTFHRVIDTGAHRLAAWEWGKGPAVLLLHDWDGEARDLESFIAPLVSAGYRALAADLPAHGRSSGSQAGVADWQRAINALARHAGTVQGVVAAGLGATVALRTALAGTALGRLALLAPLTSPKAALQHRALALGYPRERIPALLEEYETAQRLRLETLEARYLIHRVKQPMLVLEDSASADAVLSHALGFLQRGTLPSQGTVPSVEYKVAVEFSAAPFPPARYSDPGVKQRSLS